MRVSAGQLLASNCQSSGRGGVAFADGFHRPTSSREDRVYAKNSDYLVSIQYTVVVAYAYPERWLGVVGTIVDLRFKAVKLNGNEGLEKRQDSWTSNMLNAKRIKPRDHHRAVSNVRE